ncbi:MAG: FtsX-like permease family protein [Bacteroidota bacterium]
MMLLKIAWRNIWRSKTRSAVVIFAIASGLVGGLFASAWMNGMALQRVINTFSLETAHIQLHQPEFADNFDVQKTIVSTGEKLQEISNIEGVKAVTSRIKISAMAATANNNTGVTIVGIHPETEKEVFGLYQKIDSISGHFFASKKKNSIVISKALAKELKVKLRSKVVLTFSDYNGEITGAAFRVIGMFKTDNNPWDKMHVFVRDFDLRKVVEIPKGQSHEIDILLDDYEQAGVISDQIQNNYPELLSEDWSEIQPYLGFITEYMDVYMGIFMIIILAALGFGIINTMLMVILERTKELGMLMGIGMNKRRIFLMIMFETILLALVGAFAGEIVSMFLISYYGKVGLDFSSWSEGLESVGYSAVSYPMLEPFRYLQITILVILTGILASIYPAIKALKLNPAEAIRTL